MTDTDRENLDRTLPNSAATVLLAGPPTDRLRSVCTALSGADPATDILFVTYTRTPSDCLEQVADEDVGDVIVIVVGDTAPSLDDESVTTRHVTAPADLTRLGIEIGEVLEEREQVNLCFDSVTTTLQYVEYPDIYEFLHAVLGQIRAGDARAHVHINPVAHDDQVLAGLTTLFDARVDLEGEELSVRARPLAGDTRNT